MPLQSPSPVRRVVVAAALLVPLIVDPYGADTLDLKRLGLALVGLGVLAVEAIEGVSRRREILAPTAPEWILGCFALWATASLAWATNPLVGLTDVVALVGMLGVARGVRAVTLDADGARRWMTAMTVVTLIGAAIDVVFIRRQVGELAPSAQKHASLLFVHNNMAAVYAAMIVPMPIALALGTRGAWRRLGWLLLAAGCIAYLVVLRSRASVLAILLGIGLVGTLVFVRWWRGPLRVRSRRAALTLAVVVLALAALPYSSAVRGVAKDVFYRSVNVLEHAGIANLADATFRPHLFRKTIEMVSEEPLLGVGAGNFAVIHPRFDLLQPVKPHAHNDALQVLAELGFPGLVLLLALFASVALALLRSLGAPRGTPGATLAVGLAGALLVFGVCGLFEVPFVLGATAANFAILAGLATRLADSEARTRRRRLGMSPALSVLLLAMASVGCGYIMRRLPASALLAEAAEQIEAQDIDAARQTLERLASLGTGSHLPQRMLGELAMDDLDYTAALQHFRAARVLWPFGVDLLHDEGEALLRLEKYDEAVRVLRRAVEATPARLDSAINLIYALGFAGQVQEAIDDAEYMVQSNRLVPMGVVRHLAWLWQRQANTLEGDPQVRAMVASRHFFALVLQDGHPDWFRSANRQFKDLTHRLQQLPGAPESWWRVYRKFLDEGGWSMPNTALWTAMDADGRKLHPGWAEPAGPPLPRELR